MPAFALPREAAYVVITATTAMIWTILVWNIRLFVRTKIHGSLSWDDIHCTIATILGIFNSSITIVQTSYGLRRRVDHVAPSVAQQQQLLSWIAALLFILALCFAMLSVCFLIVRITKRTSQVWLAYAIAVVTSVWAVIALFLIAFMCHLPRPWVTTPLSRCGDIYHTWMGIAIVNAVLDLANIIAAIVFLWSVRMPWRTKALVLALFAMRLLVIPPTLTRLRYIKKALESRNWTYARIDVVIITQIVLHLSIILTTLPCVKPYLSAFERGALQAPTIDLRRISKQPTKEPKSITLLPLSQPRPTLKRYSVRNGMKRVHSITPTPGQAGHRRHVEAWPLRTWSNPTSTVTTVKHDPEEAKEAERRRSNDSVSSRGITRRQSFFIKFDNVEDSTEAAAGSSGGRSLTRTNSSPLEFKDAGGLLMTKPKEKEKQRNGSQSAI